MPGISDLLSVFFLSGRQLFSDDRSRTILFNLILLFVDSFFSMGSFGFMFSGNGLILLFFIIIGKEFKRIRHLFMAKNIID